MEEVARVERSARVEGVARVEGAEEAGAVHKGALPAGWPMTKAKLRGGRLGVERGR